MNHQTALNQFKQVGVTNCIAEADPHTLVAMLFEGLLERLARARGCIERDERAMQGTQLSNCIAIIDSLRASLDHEKGGELAARLGDLYDHMEFKLMQANRDCDAHAVGEIIHLARELKEGWDGIAPGTGGVQ